MQETVNFIPAPLESRPKQSNPYSSYDNYGKKPRLPIFTDSNSFNQQTQNPILNQANNYISINQVDIMAKGDPKIQKVCQDLSVLDSNCNRVESMLHSNVDLNDRELVE